MDSGRFIDYQLSRHLKHQNTEETDDDDLHLNDNTGWDSDRYDKEIGCDIHSDEEYND